MTEDRLRKLVMETLAQEIARRVLEKLEKLSRHALVVCTGSAIAFPKWLVSLQQMQEAGYTFDLYLSDAAMELLDISAMNQAVGFKNVWNSQSGKIPEKLAKNYDTVIVPALTLNTASKLAACIADTPVSRIILSSLMLGKRVVIAVDGCCPDNRERSLKGYVLNDALKSRMRENITIIKSYGAILAAADTISSRTLGIGKSTGFRASAPSSAGIGGKLNKKLIGRQDIAVLPENSDLRVPHNCQITQLAWETARIRGIRIIKE